MNRSAAASIAVFARTSSRRVFAALLLISTLPLAGCGDQRMQDVREAVRRALQSGSVEPSEAGLRELRAFSGAGVRFRHPAVLTVSHERTNGDETWDFDYGLYSLELYVADADISAEKYMQSLARTYDRDPDTGVIERPRTARRLQACGHAVQSTLFRVKLFDDPSVYEAFDLPDAADGRKRIVVLSDEPNAHGPTRVSLATERTLFATLQCDDDAAHASHIEEVSTR